MLLLPLASPSRVPVHVPAAPAAVMSRKSASVSDTLVPTVIVRVAPIVVDVKNSRYAAAVPALTVSVLLIVWLAKKVIVPIPTTILPVNVKLLNVLAPVIAPVAKAVDVKLTL